MVFASRLIKDEDAAGGSISLARVDTPSGYKVTLTDDLGMADHIRGRRSCLASWLSSFRSYSCSSLSFPTCDRLRSSLAQRPPERLRGTE
jgi:hypothetical protein